MLDALLKKRSWWEAPLVDLWTLPHLLSGVLIAYGARLYGVDFWTGLFISFSIATLWEVFEILTRISDVEHHTNGASDIAVAQIGYLAGAWFFWKYAGTLLGTSVFIAAAALFATISALGWLSHHWYGAPRR